MSDPELLPVPKGRQVDDHQVLFYDTTAGKAQAVVPVDSETGEPVSLGGGSSTPVVLEVPSDGTTTTIQGEDLPDVIVVGESLDFPAQRAHIVVDVTTTQPDEGKRCVIVAQRGRQVFGPSFAVDHGDPDSPAYLNILPWYLALDAKVTADGPIDLGAGVEVTVEVNGTPQTVEFTGTISDSSDVLGAVGTLIAGLTGITDQTAGVEVIQRGEWWSAIATTATGSSASIEITDPGDGDPLLLSVIADEPDMDNGASLPGVTSPYRGISRAPHGMGEFDGHLTTHLWPDATGGVPTDARIPRAEVVWTDDGLVYAGAAPRSEAIPHQGSTVGATLDALEAAIEDIETGSGVELGETSTTAYRGDRGKTAYDHSQVTTGNPHGTTASDLGAVPTSRTIAGLDLTANRSVADLNAALGRYRIAKPSGTARNSNAVSADPHLTQSVPAGTYLVRAMLPNTGGNNTPDIQAAITGGSVTFDAFGPPTAATTFPGSAAQHLGRSTGTPIASGTGAGGAFLRLEGVCTLGSSGTIAVEWGQNTDASTQDVTVLAGATLSIDRTT